MVFGWGRRREQDAPDAPVERRSIRLDEIPAILSESKEARIDAVVSQAEELRQSANPAFAQLLQIAQDLQNDDLKTDDVDKHLRQMMTRGKRQVVSVIMTEARRDFAEIRSYDDAVGFGKDLGRALKKIGDVLGRQSRVIHIFAKKYAQKMKEILGVLNKGKDEMKQLIENYEKTAQAERDLMETISRINDIAESKNARHKKISDLEEREKDAIQKASRAKDEIERIESTPEYVKYAETKKELEELELNRDMLRREIDDEFTKISRPLAKYQHVASDKNLRAVLETLTRSPIDAMKEENKSSILEILGSVRRAAESGSISVKDVPKALSGIDEIIRELDPIMTRVLRHEERRSGLEAKMRLFDDSDLARARTDLSRQNTAAGDSRARIESLRAEIAEDTALVPQLVRDAESELNSISASRYTVAVPD